MLERLQQQLSQKLALLPFPTLDRNTKYLPLDNSPRLGHRRQASLSSFNPRKTAWLIGAGLFLLGVCFAATTSYIGSGIDWRISQPADDNSPITRGKAEFRDGREVFWWEQFPRLVGYYRGRNDVVHLSEYVPEQQQSSEPFRPLPTDPPSLTTFPSASPEELIQCSTIPPTIRAYEGLPQGMSSALLGSMDEIGINTNICYDRINRFGPYGLAASEEEGGLGIRLQGDNAGEQQTFNRSLVEVKWHEILQECSARNRKLLASHPRTAFILRTWHTFNYTPHVVLMLRAMVNELSLRTGGQVYLHFLVHVQDDTIPIWASDELYNATLKASLPAEFQGMGTLWSVAQMKLIYPPPFPKSVVNFSGGDVYEAYRSLHFPMQYFASKHPEFDFFWQWEMDIRITGHYGELIDKITSWADRQSRDHLWERSAKFFIPSLHNNSYAEFTQSIVEETKASGRIPISRPQLPADLLLPIPSQSSGEMDVTDLITFSPIFDPSRTQWAFRDDITGYATDPKLDLNLDHRPPTRASLIAATRMSRRLLLLMHEETYRNKHTMFPEMYPASIALQYGLKAVYAPITTYFDHDWPAEHADEVFNNAKLRPESITLGMDHGGNRFHAEGGSVFGPGEHVFRGASWYSNAGFAGYLWRRWLGNENGNAEVEWEMGPGRGRMCLPMMILHPIKSDT